MPSLQPNTIDPPSPIHPISSVLVVGGCGFLGHHIVWQLLLRHPKAQIHVLDLRCVNNRFDGDHPNVSYHDGDIADPAAMAALFTKVRPEVVIHTASPHFGEGVAGADDLMYRVNVDGTKVLLAEARRNGTRAFVYTSSASVVMRRGEVRAGGIVNAAEDAWAVAGREEQWDWYMTTKALAEGCALRASDVGAGFVTCALRPAGIYGEGDVQFLTHVLRAARRGQWRFQLGSNDNLFDTTYAANAAVAHLQAAEALLYTTKLGTVPIDLERVDGEAFFITNDAPVPFWDFIRAAWAEAGVAEPTSKVWVLGETTAYCVGTLLEALLSATGRKPGLTREKAMFSCMTRYYNITKAKKRLGYRPVVGFGEGIRRAVRDIDARGEGGLESLEHSPVQKKTQ